MDIYSFKATITHELYYDAEKHWGVYVFTTEDNIPYLQKQKKQSFQELKWTDHLEATLSGQMQKLHTGQQYSIRAETKKNEKYGWQYVPNNITLEKPTTAEQTIIFLSSLCTKKQAEDIVRKYPTFVEDIIAGQKDFDVATIQTHKMNVIIETTQENYMISDIMIMLGPLGVSYKMIKKITGDIPNVELLKQTLRDNPYILTRINGLGFKRVDEIALKINPALINSEFRAKSLMTYFLTQKGMDEGHSIVPDSEIRMEFGTSAKETVHHLPAIMGNEEFVKSYKSQTGLLIHYANESFIWNKAVEMNSHCYIKPNEDYDIKKTEGNLNITFTEEQKQAILSTTESDFVIITGAAGTGKSTVVQGILDMYKGKTIGMCALAAKAAQRMYEITGEIAMTIHRLLEWKGDFFARNQLNPLEYDIIIVDEASMINSWLFKKLIEAVPRTAKVIIIFDHAQLPPIGIGNIATDLLKAKDILKVNKFTQVHRQAQKSGILSDANIIRTGINPVPRLIDTNTGELKDMWYIFNNDRNMIQKTIVESFFKAIQTNSVDDVVIIVPRKKGVLNCTTELNRIIHDRLFDKYIPHIKSGKKILSQGAKVIQRVNNYEKGVINGEIGFIELIDEQSRKFNIKFSEEKIIEYDFDEADNIDLAYALTVHSYQGSQSKVVIIGIDWTHFILLDNCLLYTAITRASKQCAIIAEPKAFSYAVKQNKNRERRTFLSKIITDGLLPFKPLEPVEMEVGPSPISEDEIPPDIIAGTKAVLWNESDLNDLDAPF